MRRLLQSIWVLIVAVGSFPSASAAATVDEARELVRVTGRTFSWTARPEMLGLLVDPDARVAFHKIVEGRPLRASDPEWRTHYAGFQRDYAAAVLKALQPIAWSSPEAERLLTETLARDLSSADAKTVLEFLESDEVKAMSLDPVFQTAWLRLITLIPRFREHELDVILNPDELKELRASTGVLMEKYPHAFQTLAPFHYSGRPPAMNRFTRLWAQWALPAASPAALQQNDTVRRLNVSIQQVVEKWKPVVAGRVSQPASLRQSNDVTITLEDSESPGAPRFEDYAVPQRYTGSPAAVALTTHRQASTWRTQLRTGSRQGPNFADHYTVVTWGCGTDCMQIAIVDARDGKVFFPENLGALSFVNIDESVFEAGVLRFRRDSRLLVVVGMPNEDPKQRGVSYYEWAGSTLRLVHRVPRKWYD